MKRILILSGILAAALLAGCTGVPGGTPGPVDGDTARAALCAAGSETSLTGLAGQLDTINDDTDTTQITTLIGTTMADLQSVQLDAGEAAVRDAAVTALGALQTAISDPNTRGQAATQAATALRAADAEICN